jgi:hypothetical protein
MSVSKMGWVTMSERDLKRIKVLTEVLAARRMVAAAATYWQSVSGRCTGCWRSMKTAAAAH